MRDPLVTCIVSSYNRPRLIRDALDSLAAQTWPNVEVIVADDWSGPEVSESLAPYITSGLVKAVVRPASKPTPEERQFGGRCAICINAAMRHAVGDFVCFLPDDDFLPPQSIEVRARYLADHDAAFCVYGRLEACKSAEPVVGVHDGRTDRCQHDRDGFWSEKAIGRAANRVDHGMMMVRRYFAGAWKPTASSLPAWPECRTAEFGDCAGELRQNADGRWSNAPQNIDVADVGDVFDCPDAGWFYRLERAGLGPFYSVPEVVVVKRYHANGHRTDPSRRE